MSDEEYISSIPEEFREVPSIKEAGSMENLLKQHVNLEQKMGTAIFKPGDGADDEQMSAFYNKVNDLAPGLTRIPTAEDDEQGWGSLYAKLGRPEDASGYEADKVMYGDQDISLTEYSEPFKEAAHSLGLSSGQYKGIIKFLGDKTIERLEAADQRNDELMKGLRGEWGDATQARIERATDLVSKFGGEGAADAMGELGNNPVVLAMLDKLADALGEESSLDNYSTGKSAERASELEAEISTLRGNAAFMDKKNPEHKSVVDRINMLSEKLHKIKQAA